MSTEGDITEGAVRRVLDEIHDPCSVSMSQPMGLDEMGLVRDVVVDADGRVEITLRLTSPFCEMVPFMKGEALRKVGAVPGVTEVEVRHDGGLEWDHDMMAPSAQERRRKRLAALRKLNEERRAAEAACGHAAERRG